MYCMQSNERETSHEMGNGAVDAEICGIRGYLAPAWVGMGGRPTSPKVLGPLVSSKMKRTHLGAVAV